MVSAAEQLAANLNFSALAKAEELKKRIWFTLGALLVYRFGTYIPLPGIEPSAWEQFFKSQAGGILGMMLGYKKIPEEWKSGIPAIADRKFNYTDFTFHSIIESNETSCAASVNAKTVPLSSLGMKPFGITANR